MTDRSYGKGPNSISPDVDDLMQRTESGSGGSSRGGGSSNSSEANDRSRPHSSSPRTQDAAGGGQGPVTFSSRTMSDLSDTLSGSSLDARNGPSLDARNVKGHDEGKKKTGDASEKSVAWNIPERDDGGDVVDVAKRPESPDDSRRLVVMDLDEHINTIKRSPYKRAKEQSKASGHDSDTTPTHRPPPSRAWDEKPPECSTPAPLPDGGRANGETSMSNHASSSAFLPFKTDLASNAREVLQVFDPLLSGGKPRENGDLVGGAFAL